MTQEDSKMTPREQWTHEDNLIADRLNWLLTSQSFLFAAYAVTLNHTSGNFDHIVVRLQSALPILALICILCIFLALIASTEVQKKLEKEYPGTVRTSTDISQLGWLPILGIPMAFTVGWLYVISA